MKFQLEEITVYFPYEYIYPEQYLYMQELKRSLDAKGHCLLEMPTGTGKTITLLSLVTAYQTAHPELGKLIYCTRTVPEMEKVLMELRELIEYRERYVTGSSNNILAVGLSSRKNLCIHKQVQDEATRESVDALCRKLTAPWVRERALEAGGGRHTGVKDPVDTEKAHAAANAAATAATGGPSTSAGAGGAAGATNATRVLPNSGASAAAAAAAAQEGPPLARAVPAIGDIEDAIDVCGLYEGYTAAATDAVLPPGVYTLQDLRQHGKKKSWCPYYLARHMIAYANVVVYSYQYMLDPKVSQMVSRELEAESVVVFDEAHNIDNVCIEALSINLREATLAAAARNLQQLSNEIQRVKLVDAQRLQAEYDKMVQGLQVAGVLQQWQRADFDNPALPQDILNEAVPGNIRRAEHFVLFLRRFVEYLKTRAATTAVVSQSCTSFLTDIAVGVNVDGKTLRFCYDRLSSLIKTLEIHNTDDYWPIQLVADFGTLLGTYDKGFAVIIEPWDGRLPHVPDPVLQLACLDASLAMKPVFDKFQTVVLTSGTLSPIDLYPQLLDFNPVASRSLQMTLTRECLCPVVLTRGADQMPVSSKFESRKDKNVLRNYGEMLVEMSKAVPDGIVCFFVSYLYMDQVINAWHHLGVLDDIMRHKLIFIETQDVVETTLALDNFRRACDCGRGAVFFSVARGKVAEGIDFDRHYGRAVVMFGVPYQYTLSRILQARLEYLQQTFQISDRDFLAFDAMRQASQCVGRVIRSKADYGMMIFADSRYQRQDKRDKLPKWITANLSAAHMDLSTDMLVHIAREFMRDMAQPLAPAAIGRVLLSEDDLAQRERARKGGDAALTVAGVAAGSKKAKHEKVAPLVAAPLHKS